MRLEIDSKKMYIIHYLFDNKNVILIAKIKFKKNLIFHFLLLLKTSDITIFVYLFNVL